MQFIEARVSTDNVDPAKRPRLIHSLMFGVKRSCAICRSGLWRWTASWPRKWAEAEAALASRFAASSRVGLGEGGEDGQVAGTN
jgi:hypothetical protein